MQGREVAGFYDAVKRFRGWADTVPENERSGEWEVNYDDWEEIYKTFPLAIGAVEPEKWSRELIDTLLYALARDNELLVLKRELEARPRCLLALAKVAVDSPEEYARSQLATSLGDASELDHEEAESLLMRYVRDEDEYVSRMALLALGRRKSPQVDAEACRAWETGDEYQRMAALDVLAAIRSSRLEWYLALARQDGRKYLVNFANELASRMKGRSNA